MQKIGGPTPFLCVLCTICGGLRFCKLASLIATKTDPFKAGMTLPTALAAPVELGMMLFRIPRPPAMNGWGVSSTGVRNQCAEQRGQGVLQNGEPRLTTVGCAPRRGPTPSAMVLAHTRILPEYLSSQGGFRVWCCMFLTHVPL